VITQTNHSETQMKRVRRFAKKKNIGQALLMLSLSLMLTLVASNNYAQILYQETFTTNGYGAIGPGFVPNYGPYTWTLVNDGASLTATTDWCKTTSTYLEWRDTDGPITWYSPPIDISKEKTIDLLYDVSNNLGGLENADYITVSYKLDLGLWVILSTDINDFAPVSYNHQTIDVISNNTIEIKAQATCNADAERLRLDNVVVQVSENKVPFTGNNSYSLCSGNIYDHNGSTINYSDNADGYTVLTPSTANSAIQLDFNVFNTESCCDKLYVYDGNSTVAPQVTGSPFAGSTLPSTILSTAVDGSLTLAFKSDFSISYDGFDATISCVSPCSGTPTPGTSTTSSNSVSYGVTITLSNTGASSDIGVTYQWQDSPDNSIWSDISGATSTSYVATVLANTYYRLKVTCTASGLSDVANVAAIVNVVSINVPLTGSNSLAICSGNIYDNGGSAGDYASSSNGYTVLTPSTANSAIQLVFNSFDVESGYDYLYVYHGSVVHSNEDAGSPFSGTTLPSTILSTAADGALTLKFTSDGSVQDPGFDATISCVSTGCSGTPTPGSSTASSYSICNGTTVNLTNTGAETGSDITYQWQSTTDPFAYPFSDISGATSTTYGATPSVDTYYRLEVTCTTSASSDYAALPSIVSVTTVPSITGTTPGSICNSGTVALGATTSAGTINWYAASSGGSSLATGISYTTPSISSTTTYYVDATDNGCTTASRTSVTATVNAIPTITGTTPGSVCNSGTVALGATTSAGTINWYAASSGGSSLATGTSYTTPSISSTTTYYVDATDNGCTTASRTSVTATVTATPTITGTTGDSRCGTGTVTLTASASAGTISWYAASSGGISLGSGTSYSPSIAVTTTFYVDATDNGCTTGSRTGVTGTVAAIPTITGATGGSVCNSGTVALGATTSAGTINWYAASSGGSSLATGTSYTTPSISSTTTYYVDATDNGCTTASRTSVTATVTPVTTSAAGADQNLTACATTATLDGNTPSAGTGAWSVVSGTATITDDTDPVSGLTGLVVGTSATLRWTITNGACSSTDDVIITANTGPGCEGYCPSTATNGSDEHVTGVVMTGGISNTSTVSDLYTDYTASHEATVEGGQDITLVVSTSVSYTDDFLYVFIDYNGDQDFTDAGEEIFGAQATANMSNPSSTTINFTIPYSASIGTTRMRIKYGYTQTFAVGEIPMDSDPCQTVYEWGEVEDYSIVIFGVTDYPYTADFESEVQHSTTAATTGFTFVTPGWSNTQTGDDADWRADAGGTGSVGTGPGTGASSGQADHTPGTSSGIYLYFESTDPNFPSKSAYLLSPTFDLTSNPYPLIEFWYSMYGATMGTLAVQATTDGGTTWSSNLKLISGDQGQTWRQAIVDLVEYRGETNVMFRFTATSIASFTSDVCLDNFRIINMADDALSVYENLNLTSDAFNAVNTTVNLVGTAAQAVRSNGFGFSILQINNSNGITLTDDLRTEKLNLIDGIVDAGARILTIENPLYGAIAGGSSSSFVVGTLRRNIAANTDTYAFPVGQGSGPTNFYKADFINNGLDLSGGTDYIQVNVAAITESGTNSDGYLSTQHGTTSITSVNETAIWTITPSNSGAFVAGDYGVKLYTENLSGLLTDNEFTIVKRQTGSANFGDWSTFWETTTIPPSGTDGRTVLSGYSQRIGFTSFSDFGTGNGSGPLPVTLTDFTAELEDGDVYVSWTVASQTNNDYFDVQRSVDGDDWENIATIEGAGTINQTIDYSHIDREPLVGISYYRLKQTDFDGNFEIFDPVAITYEVEIVGLLISPNPVKEAINISIDGAVYNDLNVIRVYDSKGEIVLHNNLIGNLENYQLQVGNLAPGIYLVKSLNRKQIGTGRFIKE